MTAKLTFSQEEVPPFLWSCLEVQRNPSKFRAALYYFCQSFHCALRLFRKAKRLFLEEWSEYIANDLCSGGNQASERNLCNLSALWENEVGYKFFCIVTEAELTILKCEYCELVRSSFKWLLHLADDTSSHTVRNCYPGFFQSFCNPERAAMQF